MRADRLVAIVLLLQTHGQLTATQLAERLEASERTIRRDLDSLSAAGVPVYAQRGRGGGWALLGGNKIDLSGLTSGEAEALFLVAGPQALAGLNVGPGVRSALRKLMAALPAPMRDQAAAANAAIHVDPVGWGKRVDEPAHLDALRQATIAGLQVDLAYAKPREEPSTRRVHPFGLVSKGGTWYLLAGSEAGLRTFRVSRVRGVVTTDHAVERPPDFDLAAAWERVRDSLPGVWGGLEVDLLIHPRAEGMVAGALRRWNQIRPLGPGADGWARWSATFPTARAAAVELARFGNQVRVVSPAEVTAALVLLAQEILEAATAGQPDGIAPPADAIPAAARRPAGGQGTRRSRGSSQTASPRPGPSRPGNPAGRS